MAISRTQERGLDSVWKAFGFVGFCFLFIIIVEVNPLKIISSKTKIETIENGGKLICRGYVNKVLTKKNSAIRGDEIFSGNFIYSLDECNIVKGRDD